MSDEDQAPPAGGDDATPPAAAPTPHPVFEFLETAADTPAGPALPPPPLPRRTLQGALAIALLGLAALVLGQVEAALLVAMGALYFVAQGADVHPGMERVHLLLGWIPSAMGAVLLGAVAALLAGEGGRTPLRLGMAAFSGAGALACLASLLPPVANGLVRLLFRGCGPSHTLRLSARLVLVLAWMAAPVWLALRDLLDELLRDPGQLVSPSKLTGALIGYVVLALTSVGFLVRRDWRQARERLGLTLPRVADSVAIGLGVAALWLFNAGAELLQRRAFPALWAGDQAFTGALAGVMGPGQMLLGLSAGVGEEITLRGALQPKLGITLTSLLFAALHVQYSWYGMLSILGFGLILGVIRQRSGTTAAILVHALYDLLAVAASKP